ncbi:MAG: phosphatidate cytidylyltransferase [Planctomycetia bacterium]|nr:phosphatidate cytidylyltransferase [Planctomycetia bacterium]
MISVYCLSYAPALLTHKAFKNPPLPAGAISPAAGGGSAAASATNGGAPASSAGVFPTSTPNDDVELVAQASSQPVTDDVAPREDPLAGTAQENGASPTAPATSGAAPTTPRNPAVGAPAQAIQPAIGQPGGPLSLPQRARLLFYFVVVIQIGDIMQYVWGKLLGKTVIAPDINPERTWEGFAGAVLSGTVLGTLLGLATPFAAWEAALLSAVICAIGFAGGMTMSAIKRDRGVRDYGTLVVGHGGVLDRIDSICFAAPVFFYLTRILLGPYEGV